MWLMVYRRARLQNVGIDYDEQRYRQVPHTKRSIVTGPGVGDDPLSLLLPPTPFLDPVPILT